MDTVLAPKVECDTLVNLDEVQPLTKRVSKLVSGTENCQHIENVV